MVFFKNTIMKIKMNIAFYKYILIFLAIIIFIFSFLVNIGINNSYFIRKDFSQAFLARQTGNCYKFKYFVSQDKDNWFERCEEEKKGISDGIRKFEIKEITVDGNLAFLQVEIQRDLYKTKLDLSEAGHKLPDGGYLVDYQMRKIGMRWFINQELR